MNYRDLPPVEDNIEEPEFLSQTFLSHVDSCPRAGFLYRNHRRGPSSHPMDRGTAAHIAFAEMAQALIDNNESTLPPDVAKAIVNGVIKEQTHLTYPAEDKDDVRIMGFHWAKGMLLEPSSIAGIEKGLELEIAGKKVRGVADLIQLYPKQHHARIVDFKTSFAIPSQSAFERSFQTRFYALMLKHGIGSGDTIGLGAGVETVDVVQVYPRYLRKDGLIERTATINLAELADFRHDVEATIARAERGFETGKWQPVTSSHCAICPAAHECPLPRELLVGFMEGEWAVADDPVRAAELRYHYDRIKTKAQTSLRAHVKEHGPVYYGPVEPGKPGRVFGASLETRNSVVAVKLPEGGKLEGQDAIQYRLDEAALEGKAFDLNACYRESTSTKFMDRKHEPDDVEDSYDA